MCSFSFRPKGKLNWRTRQLLRSTFREVLGTVTLKTFFSPCCAPTRRRKGGGGWTRSSPSGKGQQPATQQEDSWDQLWGNIAEGFDWLGEGKCTWAATYLPPYNCWTQTLLWYTNERCVKMVTEACGTVYGEERRDGLIKSQQLKRQLMSKNSSKQDITKLIQLRLPGMK